MRLVNLTPHTITICLDRKRGIDGPAIFLASEGLARVASETGAEESIAVEHGGDWHMVPVFNAPSMGGVTGLPAPSPGVGFVVSFAVCEALRGLGRSDVLCPGTGPTDGAIRYTDGPQKGQVRAVTRLNRCPL